MTEERIPNEGTRLKTQKKNQVEISNLPKKEFKVTIVKMIEEEKRKTDEQSEKK